jgi:hypothetical protein
MLLPLYCYLKEGIYINHLELLVLMMEMNQCMDPNIHNSEHVKSFRLSLSQNPGLPQFPVQFELNEDPRFCASGWQRNA